MTKQRIEKDSMGDVVVPADALYGAQTQRALNNFDISDIRLPRAFIRALGLIKQACALSHQAAGRLNSAMATAIAHAAQAVAAGDYDEQFPISVFQTGSGTSTNMNANEVIATLASRALGAAVHPNDHVNMSQSSNDVIPSAIHVAAALQIQEQLLPALAHLTETIERRAEELKSVVKTGRTHLMDALPITLGQELGAWAGQIRSNSQRLEEGLARLRILPQGGTAVGTGVNASAAFGAEVAAQLSHLTGQAFVASSHPFEQMSAQDTAVEMSGHLNTLAVSLMKIANDLRWMNSGPLAGLGEISLPALQPGSSIMPGKVNPVIPEVVAMAAAQVMGQHVTLTIAGQSGNFQLNVMLPLIAHNLLNSIDLLSRAARSLTDKAIAGFTINTERLQQTLAQNPILVTALNDEIGYERAAQIAKRAYQEGRPIFDVALEMVDTLDAEQLRRLLDPIGLARGARSL
ncbi:MAG: class II fumarate hydratase [Gammaproteobacteria bacterium]|nr:class II fumarate hydratase [Gammaproteobacteria bacterium]